MNNQHLYAYTLMCIAFSICILFYGIFTSIFNKDIFGFIFGLSWLSATFGILYVLITYNNKDIKDSVVA